MDQQFAQAQAQLKLAQAAFDLAEVTYKRAQNLFKTRVISTQEFDTAADNYAGARSTVVADQAAVGRLKALEDFKILHAPFDGIVTARNTDIGAYIPAGSGTQLFRMAATSRLHVYVTVPQALSSLIRVGEQAELTVDQLAGRKFSAHVVSTAGLSAPTPKGCSRNWRYQTRPANFRPAAMFKLLWISRSTTGASSYRQKPYCFRLHNRRSRSSMPMVRWQFKASPSSMIWARNYKFRVISLNWTDS